VKGLEPLYHLLLFSRDGDGVVGTEIGRSIWILIEKPSPAHAPSVWRVIHNAVVTPLVNRSWNQRVLLDLMSVGGLRAVVHGGLCISRGLVFERGA
jgi:hypothetical protein